jgi:hypothetical protein
MSNAQQQQPNPSPQPAAVQTLEVMPAPSQEYVREAEQQALAFMNPKRWQMMDTMAKTWIVSGAMPSTIKNAPQLMMVLQSGYECGLQPIEAINSFYFVNGKLTMYGDAVISQVAKAGHKIEWGKCDTTTATVKITRGDNQTSFSATLTMDEVKQRGMNTEWKEGVEKEKNIWKKYPDTMLRYRVFGMVARFIVPDALHGIPIKEEIEGTPAEIIVETTEVKPAPAAEQKPNPEAKPAESLADAIEKKVEQPKPEEKKKPEPSKPEPKKSGGRK